MKVQWKLAVALLLLVPTASARGADEADWDAPTKKWIKGPVSYLATDAEVKQYKKAPEQDRPAFIREFWARRDPTPGTEENLFRDRFLARVAAADALLKKLGIPAGWKSDPGKVLILLGQPDDFRREELEGSAPGGPGGTGPSRYDGGGAATPAAIGGDTVRLVFSYRDAQRLGLPPEVDLEFLGDGHSFRLTTRVDLATDAIRGLDPELLAEEFPAGAAAEEQLTLAPPVEQAAPAAAPDAAGEMSVQRRLLTEALDGGPLPDAVPVAATLDFYKTLAGRTYVAITLGIDEAAVEGTAELHPVAAFRDVDDPENLFLYDSDDLFAPSEFGTEDGILRYQAGDGVTPGSYKAVYGFVSADGSRAGLQERTIEVPDFEVPGVHLSTLTLVAAMEDAEGSSSELKRPYILGNRIVVPKVRNVYPQDGSLMVYYQVYNATEGPDGKHNLRIAYKIYQKRGTRFVRAAVVPPMNNVTNLVQIYELQITKAWRPGEYKLKVTVEDKLGGTFAEGEAPFQVR